MFEIFETHITSYANFTTDELQYIRSLSSVKKVRRKECVLQEGEICRYKIFVCKGLLKTYRLKEDGTEYIMRFAPENTWTTDHVSYVEQTPSKNNIEALEDSSVVMFSREDLMELYNTIPSFKMLSDKLVTSSLDASQERLLLNISATSEEKYQHFITAFPNVFNRVPLHMVASYLGVSRETLSRIRHAQLK